MNSRLKIGTLLVALSTLWMAVWADAPLKSYKDIPSPERNARLITEAMQSRLGLTEKQYKKVYKIQLVEQKTIFKYKPTPQRGIEKDLGEMPLQGHRMEGGRPPGRGGFEGMGGGRPPMPPREMDWNDDRPDPEKIAKALMKAAQKRDKKLKKVLDKGQYEQWLRLEDEVMAPFRFKPEPDRPGRPGPKNVETLFR